MLNSRFNAKTAFRLSNPSQLVIAVLLKKEIIITLLKPTFLKLQDEKKINCIS